MIKDNKIFVWNDVQKWMDIHYQILKESNVDSTEIRTSQGLSHGINMYSYFEVSFLPSSFVSTVLSLPVFFLLSRNVLNGLVIVRHIKVSYYPIIVFCLSHLVLLILYYAILIVCQGKSFVDFVQMVPPIVYKIHQDISNSLFTEDQRISHTNNPDNKYLSRETIKAPGRSHLAPPYRTPPHTKNPNIKFNSATTHHSTKCNYPHSIFCTKSLIIAMQENPHEDLQNIQEDPKKYLQILQEDPKKYLHKYSYHRGTLYSMDGLVHTLSQSLYLGNTEADSREKNIVMDLPRSLLIQSQARWITSLIGRLLTDVEQNPNEILNAIRQKWKLKKKLDIVVVQGNLFILRFEKESDKIKILRHQPWQMLGYLLVLKPFSPDQVPNQTRFDTTPLWITFEGLHLEHQLPLFIERIATAAGRVLQVFPADNEPRDADGFRARVEVDLNHPLRQGRLVQTVDHGSVWISFH
ncbi:hypothetical protein IFM89_004073 [Coptis chinensis]|uniref:DUF4283 domain-containing protein n=1 Tax=Coptis chinensis TaxID=261450 RepID=A0A835H6B2_9MAGN|nr:hypothetical protein IFM89_004073 [Coptis chinensis]